MNQRISSESMEARASGDKDRLRAMTLEYVRRCRGRGAIADEICASLQLGHNSVAPRITELKRSGLITDLFDGGGKRVRRQTRLGCHAGVVVAVEFALSKLPSLNRSLFGDGALEGRY